MQRPNLRENAKVAAICLLLFVYCVLIFSLSSVTYIETVHRISVKKVFDESVFVSTTGDALAALGLMLFYVALSRVSVVTSIVAGFLFAFSLAALFANISSLLVIAGVCTVPSLAVILIARRLAVNHKTSRLFGFLDSFTLDYKRVGFGVLIIIIALESGSLIRWASYPISPSEFYGDSSWRIAGLESALYHTLGLLSPVLLVMLVFSYLYKNAVLSIVRRLRSTSQSEKSGNRYDAENVSAVTIEESDTGHEAQKAAGSISVRQELKTEWKHLHLYLLVASLAIGPFITIYPHLQNVNPQQTAVGTDEKFYVDAISGLKGREPGEAAAGAFKTAEGDRPLAILILLGLTNLTGLSPELIVRYFPVLLAPSLSAATYVSIVHARQFGNKAGTMANSKNIAALAALVASVSPQVVVGLYGGLLANWLALIPTLFAMMLSIRLWDIITRSGQDVNLGKIVGYALSIIAVIGIIMLIHVYAWGYILLSAGVFLLISCVNLRKSVPRARTLQSVFFFAAIISVSFALDLIKSHVTEVVTGTERDLLVVTRLIGVENYAVKWQTLYFTMSQYVGGFLSTPVLLFSAILWVFRLKQRDTLDHFLYASIVVACIPILLGSSVVQARVLYNMFLFIPTAILVLGTSARRELSIAVFLVMIVYCLRAAANFYLILPENFELETTFLTDKGFQN